MSSLRRDDQYLADIRESISRILNYSEGISYDEFVQNTLIQDGVLRNFQVIGEAAKKLSDVLCARHPFVPWHSMAGLRDRIVHDYFGVDYQIVWDVIRNDLPSLLSSIDAVLQEEIGDQGAGAE